MNTQKVMLKHTKKDNFSLLKSFGTLTDKVAVYIPSTVNVNEKANNSEWFDYFTSLFSNIFGGCSSFQVSGFWISEQCGKVEENTTIVYSYCEHAQLNDSLPLIIAQCRKMCRELTQECISLEVNNRLHFITKSED